MTMLTEDYIMRLINQVLAVFLQALGLKKAGKYDEALQVFDQSLENLLGLNASLTKQLDDNQVLLMLTFQDKLDVERLLVLADIYVEEAEVYTALRQPQTSQSMAQSSLRFYLEVILSSEAVPGLEIVQKVEELRQKLTLSSLPVETRLALMDYLDRLLASDDNFLAAAGLSRQDLQATLTSLDTPDLH
jgi:tetratricopeptide (TPR) repeat protein